jgi:hypothetical protein
VAKRCPLIRHEMKLTVPESHPTIERANLVHIATPMRRAAETRSVPVPQTLWLGTSQLHTVPALKVLH